MELRNYLGILWRRKWVVVVTLIVTMAVVSIGTFLAAPIYSASALLRIAAAATGAVNYADYMYADRLLNTYVTISTTGPVLDELQQRLDLGALPEIDVKIIPNTELIEIIVEDKDPAQASKVANALAEILISQSNELYTGGGQSSLEILSKQLTEMENEITQLRTDYLGLVAQNPENTESIQAAKQTLDLKQSYYGDLLNQYEQVRLNEALRSKYISIAQPAAIPLTPSKPNKVLNIVLGFFVGGVGGLGLAFLFENLDTTLYTVEQIESLSKLPNLGMIPNANIQKRFISLNDNNPYVEAFRQIRTSILRLDMDKPLCTLLITSSEPGEGKSTIVTNLAYTLAQSGQKVIVIDSDFRLPSQHKLFNLPNKQGLSNVLMQTTRLEEAIQNGNIPGLKVLTSGPIPRYTSELLGTVQMTEVIDQLRKSFDIILFDTPAFLQVSDTAVLLPYMDAVVLVVSRASSRRERVLAVCKQLEEYKARMIGFIINRANQDIRNYYQVRRPPSIKKSSRLISNIADQ